MTGGAAGEEREQLGYHCSSFCSSPSSPHHRLMQHPPYLVAATGYTTTPACFKHLCLLCVSYSAYGGLRCFFHLIFSQIFTRRGCALVVLASTWVFHAAVASYPLHGWLPTPPLPPLFCIMEDSSTVIFFSFSFLLKSFPVWKGTNKRRPRGLAPGY